MRIAALIPVYSEPKALASICERLADDPYQDKEIVVVVDGDTTASIAAALGRISTLPCLRIIKGQGHFGKAAALNRASESVEADALLFLDNDIFLPASLSFLEDLASCLERRDLVELPKVGMGEGFFAQMMKMEFLSNLYTAELMASSLGACPSMNGAAFAIRKGLFEDLGGFAATVNEDMDLAARAFLSGASFGFPPELAVGNAVSERVPDWRKQRKRWMTNNALWSGDYLWTCLKSSPEATRALLASAFRFALPWLAMAAGALPAILVARLLGSSPHWVTLAAILGAGGAWSIAAGPFERCARRYGAQFDSLSFLAYSVLYMPIMAVGNLGIWISIALGAVPKLDWKLAKGRAELGSNRRSRDEVLARTASLRAKRAQSGWNVARLAPWLAPPKSVRLNLAYARYRAHAHAAATAEASTLSARFRG
jgi:cellulose synthase/poly-beta-1,6-N-acetylglucosamine synthase-like glycosyltransferase